MWSTHLALCSLKSCQAKGINQIYKVKPHFTPRSTQQMIFVVGVVKASGGLGRVSVLIYYNKSTKFTLNVSGRSYYCW